MIATLVGPSRLITPPTDAPAGGVNWTLAILTALAVALIAAAVVVLLQRRSRIDPRERAFMGLCRRLGLGPRERNLVRHLAAGAPPATLLLSPTAFRAACERANPKKLRPNDLARVAGVLGLAAPREQTGWTA